MTDSGNAHAQGTPQDRAAQRFRPPEPVGTPYKGDPDAPFPFETEAAGAPQQEPPPFPYGPPPPAARPSDAQSAPPPGFGTTPEQQRMMLPPEYTQQRMRSTNVNVDRRKALTAFWVSVVSLFFFGVAIGPIGVVLGVRAVRGGERTLGWWAIVLGSLGFISSAALIVLVSTGVIDDPLESLRNMENSK
jgi:hypothetical protein